MVGSLRPLGAATLLALGVAQRPALAQASSPPPAEWKASASITPWFQSRVDLAGGGGFDARGAIIKAGADGPIGGGHHAGVTLSYDYTEYRFSSPAAFGSIAPWTNVHHVGLAVPFFLGAPSQWTLLVIPSVDYFVEGNAGWSEAPAYGGVVAASKRFGPSLQLGLGVSGFRRLEEVSVIPFPLVDWRISDRLRLGNALGPGPTGGAGLELSYQLDAAWRLGVGGGYRSARFRLREGGPYPKGIGEERAIPAFAHVGRSFGRTFVMDIHAGALFGGTLRVEDSRGVELAEHDYNPAPFVGGTLSSRF
jgi:hypothetical protein